MTRATAQEPVEQLEVRVLDGPNLYFTRPAVKLTLAVPGLIDAPEDRVARLAARAGVPVGARTDRGRRRVQSWPGPAGTEHRLRFAVRLIAHVTRAVAEAAGTALAVRSRVGPGADHVVVAFPWRRRHAAEALAREVGEVLRRLVTGRASLPRLAGEAAARLRLVDPGPAPDVPDPAIPVVAVTGTNGKTTTVRLLAHLVRSAGKHVAYSSTDGVYFDDVLVESGDYSGYGGAARALAQPGVHVAVLETARGGILLRGMGTLHNDVAVVTNVSADHLGLQGINTVDQLAEVKAAITRITQPGGWDVLNADDPRVLAMRRVIRGRPWMCSLDHDHPALRNALAEGGRGMTVVDGQLTMLVPGADPDPLMPLEDIPVTLAGISSHNIQNAMGAAAGALGIGLPRQAVVKGLRTFVLDPERNPGRTNLFELEGRIVVVDYAHNEAGMAGLVETCRGLRAPGREIWLAICSAGDRTPEIRHGFAYLAARGADRLFLAELLRYLRGAGREEVVEGLKAGAFDAGMEDVPVFEDELSALKAMLAEARRGDVVAVTALAQRPEIFAYLDQTGAKRLGPGRVRQLVRRARDAAVAR